MDGVKRQEWSMLGNSRVEGPGATVSLEEQAAPECMTLGPL